MTPEYQIIAEWNSKLENLMKGHETLLDMSIIAAAATLELMPEGKTCQIVWFSAEKNGIVSITHRNRIVNISEEDMKLLNGAYLGITGCILTAEELGVGNARG